MTIQPTNVYPPGAPIPPSGGGGNRTYQTYNTRYIPPSGGPYASTGPFPGKNTVRSRLYTPPANQTVRVPNGIPTRLGNKAIIFNAWWIAIIIISYDEWHNLGIFPRPARLWKATEVYGLLYLFALVDALVPLANALAIGYTIALLWQYYNGGITPSATAGSGSGNTTQQGPFSTSVPGIIAGIGT